MQEELCEHGLQTPLKNLGFLKITENSYTNHKNLPLHGMNGRFKEVYYGIGTVNRPYIFNLSLDFDFFSGEKKHDLAILNLK